ncbi:MAG: hypothetical protein NC936_00335 [Candidatus Omnitrophica bacterium]|nr:hypothetical protein [Candidatus Omnitrophota bacterium]
MTIGGEERIILSETYEPLSAIRYIRNQDFEKLKDFDLNINTNQKNYGMKGVVLSKERISLNHKNYFVWKLKANIAGAIKTIRIINQKLPFICWMINKKHLS